MVVPFHGSSPKWKFPFVEVPLCGSSLMWKFLDKKVQSKFPMMEVPWDSSEVSPNESLPTRKFPNREFLESFHARGPPGFWHSFIFLRKKIVTVIYPEILKNRAWEVICFWKWRLFRQYLTGKHFAVVTFNLSSGYGCERSHGSRPYEYGGPSCSQQTHAVSTGKSLKLKRVLFEVLNVGFYCRKTWSVPTNALISKRCVSTSDCIQ